jgi:hypothetical protein
MAFESTSYGDRWWLASYFCFGAFLFLMVILVPPSGSVVGIFLAGLLVTLGAIGYGAVCFGCLVAAGLLGVGLGLMIGYGSQYFKNRLKSSQTHHNLSGEKMDEKNENQLTLSEERTTGLFSNQVGDFDAIKDFEQWGEEVRLSLYENTLKGEKEAVEKILEENSKILVTKYKQLALKYHPDREPDISQKRWKTSAFQDFQKAYETINTHWTLALRGIDIEKHPVATDQSNNRQDNTSDLLKEQNTLLKELIETLKKYRQQISDFNSEYNIEMRAYFTQMKSELISEIKTEIKAEIEAKRNKPTPSLPYNTSFWKPEEKDEKQKKQAEEYTCATCLTDLFKSVSSAWKSKNS